jgi:hypothetical protein
LVTFTTNVKRFFYFLSFDVEMPAKGKLIYLQQDETFPAFIQVPGVLQGLLFSTYTTLNFFQR